MRKKGVDGDCAMFVYRCFIGWLGFFFLVMVLAGLNVGIFSPFVAGIGGA